MNKPSKCKNCQWYGKPYWSIINPCDNCPNENEYKTIIKVNDEPIFKETIEIPLRKATYEELQEVICELQVERYIKNKEIDRLNNIISELEKYLHQEILEWKDVDDEWTKAQVQEDEIILNELKELKEKE